MSTGARGRADPSRPLLTAPRRHGQQEGGGRGMLATRDRAGRRALAGLGLAFALSAGVTGTANAIAAPPRPPAPTGLTATAAGGSAVNLTWGAPTAPAGLALLSYDVYRGTSSGGESTVPVNSVPLRVTSDTVSGLDSGITYYFDVTAVYATGQSLPSREAFATTAKLTGPRKPQRVDFGALAARAVGARFTISASASSGLPVSFGSDTPRACAVSRAAVKTLAAGRCEIRASQGGNA